MRMVVTNFNTLNSKLNTLWHFLVLLGAHHILHVSRTRVNILSAVRLELWNKTAHWCLDISQLGRNSNWLSLEQKYKAMPKYECTDVNGCTRKACQREKEILFATRYTLTVRAVYKKRWNSFLYLSLASYRRAYVNFGVSRDHFNERERPVGIFCLQLQ